MATRSHFFLLTNAFLVFSCKNGGVEPPQPQKNPREYTWEVTTLSYPNSSQTDMNSIWGSSAQDVYVVGHNDRAFGKMYHYDGKEWKPVDLAFGLFDLWAIYGFAPNDIYAAGSRFYPNPNPPPNFIDSALIIHFDGTSWKESEKISASGVLSLWARSATEIYAGTEEGKVLKLQGNQWKVQTLPRDFQARAIGGDQNRIFAAGRQATGQISDSAFIFINDGSVWSMLDAENVSEIGFSRFGYSSIFSPAPGVFYSAHWGIFSWNLNRWEKLFRSDTTIIHINGTSVDNIFAVGVRVIYHWNGTDWKRLDILTNPVPMDALFGRIWTDGREAFIAGNDGFQTYILHGK